MDPDPLRQRIAEAEELIRAQNELQDAMYNNDLAALWPTRATELQNAYEQRYGVNLEGENG